MTTRSPRPTARWVAGTALALGLALSACSSTSTTTVPGQAAPPASPTSASATGAGSASGSPSAGTGTLTLVSLGDSLTSGEGDDSGRGYTAGVADALGRGGRNVVVVNLGRSGWTSQDLIDGADGDGGQLAAAVAATTEARAEGGDVIATVLIGSNDLWRLYDEEGVTAGDAEQANLDRYRRNLEQTVGALRGAGARVVLGINDDQSERPVMTDRTIRENTLPGITDGEVAQMSAQARRYADVVRDIAGDDDLPVADFLDASLFREAGTLADDGVHPNTKGYEEMAKVWQAALGTGG